MSRISLMGVTLLTVTAAGCGAGRVEISPHKEAPWTQVRALDDGKMLKNNPSRFGTADLCSSLGNHGTTSPDQVSPPLCAIHLPERDVLETYNVNDATGLVMRAVELVMRHIEPIETGVPGVACTYSSDPIQMANSLVVCQVADLVEDKCVRSVDQGPGHITVSITCPIEPPE